MGGQPKLYTDLAEWYHLLTAPEDYGEEAAFYFQVFSEAAGTPPASLLDLGSGGGNMSSHFKQHVPCTLVDLSPHMLAASATLNPDLEHIPGDMRTVRLGRQFDAVFVHDAVMYMTSQDDLRRAIITAYEHTRQGGVAIFVPDAVRETYRPSTSHGGHDGEGRALRYLAWDWDPDPDDDTYLVDYAYLLHEDGQPTRTVYDQHQEGLFSRAVWLRLLGEAGFAVTIRPLIHSEVEPGSVEVFVCIRPQMPATG